MACVDFNAVDTSEKPDIASSSAKENLRIQGAAS
jgi:hypothetical protein